MGRSAYGRRRGRARARAGLCGAREVAAHERHRDLDAERQVVRLLHANHHFRHELSLPAIGKHASHVLYSYEYTLLLVLYS